MNDNELPVRETDPAPAEKRLRRYGVSPASVLLLILLAVIVTAALTFSLTIMGAKQLLGIGGDTTLGKIFNKLTALNAVIDDEYIGEIDESALLNSVLAGYINGLGDDYAAYFDSTGYAGMLSDVNGEGVGIGVNVIYNDIYKAIEIAAVFPDTPALEAGLSPGDLIVSIGHGENAVSVAQTGYAEALSLLRGEVGSTAEFTVLRGEAYSESEEISIVRRAYTECTVMSRLYSPDNSVGVIRITSFDRATPDQFTHAVSSLIEQGAKSLIIDVRYNPGGELTSVCKVLDFLLPEGPVIRTIDKKGNEEVVYSSDSEHLDLPLAVVVNGGTASAGELFTAALMDYNKAVTVGTTTYGKGSMQTTTSFGDGTGVKFTYRYYCPPFSDNYDGIGITPDITVEPSEAVQSKNIYKVTDAEDNQLAAAYNALKK